jgi:type IV pilus assembly protein PilF
MNGRGLGWVVLLCAALVAGCATTPDDAQIAPKQSAERRAQLHAELGASYMRRGQYNIALDELNQALAAKSDSALANYVMAVLQSRLGKADAAERYFKRAIAVKKDYPDAEHEYGVFLCSHGRPEEAFKWFDKVLKDPLYSARALVSLHAGECMLRRRNPDLGAASRYIDAALRVDPRLPAALIAMSETQFRMGTYLQARAYIERFFATGRQTPRALLLGAKIEHAMQSDDVAARYAKKLDQKYPKSPEAGQVRQLKLEPNP